MLSTNVTNLLMFPKKQFKKRKKLTDILKETPLSPIIEEMVMEKIIEYRDRSNCDIKYIKNRNSKSLISKTKPMELRRVISNIINNAVQAIDDKGKIELFVKKHDDYNHIIIKDNGKGIPKKILQRIGNIGETHGKEKGLGLGLYHAKQSIESWGGTFKIESKENVGTTVTLKIKNCKKRPDRTAVLLDDDNLVHLTWKHSAKKNKINLNSYFEPNELFSNLNTFNKETPFYIDANLSNNQKGRDVVLKLNNLGYKNLFIASGMNKNEFNKLNFLKGVIGKSPKWN